MTTTEFQIREKLAKQLDKIDPKLKLVKQEHYIKIDGEKVFIDILAKDDFGCFTVIELKKSKNTARSTVQQLYKYANFLKRKYQLEEYQIRCVAVSTHWDELNAPFSEFKHFSAYETKGFLLETEDLENLVVSEVNPPYVQGDIKPFEQFLFFEFKEKEIRDQYLDELTNILNQLSSLNCVSVKLNYDGSDQQIMHPFGFTLTVFQGCGETIINELSQIHNSSLSQNTLSEQEEGEPEDTPLDISIFIANNLKTTELEGNGEFNLFALHSYNNTIATWKKLSTNSHGKMFEDDLFDESEVIDMCSGFLGQHPYNFKAKTTPQRNMHFNMIRASLKEFLQYNSNWQSQINHILESLDQDDTVNITIFNTLNFFGYINDIYKTGSSRREPFFEIEVIKNNGYKYHYCGILAWNFNTPLPFPKPEDAVLHSYPDLKFFLARIAFQNLTNYDQKLSSQYGLSYETIKIDGPNTSPLEYSDTSFVTKTSEIYTLPKFIEKNPDIVKQVGQFYKSHVALIT